MDNQVNPISATSVPQVVVIEPSPVSNQSGSVESLVKKIESIAEVAANGETSESVKQCLEKDAATQRPSANLSNGGFAANGETSKSVEQDAATPGPSATLSSGEFVTAQECNPCIVTVPEVSGAEELESSTAIPEPEQDNFRTADEGCCTNCGMQSIEYYQKALKMANSRYALPFWVLLVALPISGCFFGAKYMYSCPASHSLPMLMFTVGVSLMALLTFRICYIIRRMTTNASLDLWKNMLRTLLLLSTFVTIVFFITESMAFWKMAPSTHAGPEYCDPNFVTYSFW